MGHLSLTTCGMTDDTCVRYPAPWKGAVVAMPSCDPEGTREHSRAGNAWHRNHLRLSQARSLLTQTFLLLLSHARFRRLQDFPGSLRSICEMVCPQLSEASRVMQHGGPLLGPTGTYISSASPLTLSSSGWEDIYHLEFHIFSVVPQSRLLKFNIQK